MDLGQVTKEETQEIVEKYWKSWFIPALSDFVRVPNLTPMIDNEYLSNGLLEKSVECIDDYFNKLQIKGLSKYIYKSDTGIPLVCYIVEPSGGCTKNIMVYGHLDK